MSEIEIIRTACMALWHRRGRAFLTMIGVVIGVCAIIATLAIGAGARKSVKDKIYSMGENHLFVYRGVIESGKKVSRSNTAPTKYLTIKDLKALCEQIDEILSISPMTIRNEIISFGSKNIDVQVKSGNESIFAILKRKIEEGNCFTQDQVYKK